jgi:hypothetical protein
MSGFVVERTAAHAPDNVCIDLEAWKGKHAEISIFWIDSDSTHIIGLRDRSMLAILVSTPKARDGYPGLVTAGARLQCQETRRRGRVRVLPSSGPSNSFWRRPV